MEGGRDTCTILVVYSDQILSVYSVLGVHCTNDTTDSQGAILTHTHIVEGIINTIRTMCCTIVSLY